MVYSESTRTEGPLALDSCFVPRPNAPLDSPRMIPIPEAFIPMPTSLTQSRQGRMQDDIGQQLKFYSRARAGQASEMPATAQLKRINIDNAIAKAQQDGATTTGSRGLLGRCYLGTEANSGAFTQPCTNKYGFEPRPLKNNCIDLEIEQVVSLLASKLSAGRLPGQCGPPGLNIPASRGVKAGHEAFSSEFQKGRISEIEYLLMRSLAGKDAPPGLHAPATCFATNATRLPSKSSVSSMSSWKPEDEDVEQDLSEDSDMDPLIKEARQVASAGGGLSGYRTVMIQQIPFKYTQGKFMNEVNGNGFAGTYDFLYLPVNARNRGNRGFGFINFKSASMAEKFYCEYFGKGLLHHEASLPLSVIPADIQGFEQSAARFFDSWQLRKKKRHSEPVFMKPVPGYLREQGSKSLHIDNVFKHE